MFLDFHSLKLYFPRFWVNWKIWLISVKRRKPVWMRACYRTVYLVHGFLKQFLSLLLGSSSKKRKMRDKKWPQENWRCDGIYLTPVFAWRLFSLTLFKFSWRNNSDCLQSKILCDQCFFIVSHSVTSPLLLIAVSVAGGGCLVISYKNQGKKIKILGENFITHFTSVL